MAVVLGHENVKNILSSISQSGRFGNAYIFHGPAGCGKKEIALKWAYSIIKSTSQFHPDLLLIDEGEYENILIETIRRIKKFMSLTPNQSEKKVVIINNAQNLTQEAQNAFLKIFEEAPNFGIMILITENPDSLLETIVSRGMPIRFSKPNKKHFEKLDTDPDWAELLDWRPAQLLNLDEHLEFFNFLVRLAKTPLESRFAMVEDFLKKSQPIDFFKSLLGFLKTCLETKVGVSIINNRDLKNLIFDFNSNMQISQLAEKIKKVQNIYFKLQDTNFNPKFALLELTLLI